MIFINNRDQKFTAVQLPWEVQLSPLKSAIARDMNGDGLADLLLAGNFYENNVQLGRNDADFGSMLINKGGSKFVVQFIPGIRLKGQVRKLVEDNGNIWVIRNSETSSVIHTKHNKK